MSASGGIEFELNEEALRKALHSVDGDVAKAIKTILARAESAAKRRCRVDTGRLRSSITSAIEEEDGGIVGILGSNVEYAAAREFGYTMANGTEVPPDAYLRGGLNEAINDTITRGAS